MKRVLVALRLQGIAGQEKLSGIFRYLGDTPEWDVRFIRSAQEFTAARVKTAIADGYDGFIVSVPDAECAAEPLADTDIPTIVMDIHSPALSARKKNIVFIRNSPEEIGRAAANHLLSIGHCKSYAFVHHQSVMQWSVDRFRSYRDTLREHGFECHELKSPEGIEQLERPVGVFAANDDRGYDVIEFCRANHLRVPEDIAVIGINNDTLVCENCHPRLSSIQPDFEQEGYLAAETLSRMMSASTPAPSTKHQSPTSNRQPPTTNRQPPTTLFVGVKQVVRRESTAELSASGKLVQRALVYIRRNALKGISVTDVAAHLHVSRRLADLRFRELQGTTIGETIINERLTEVKRLLRETKEPIDTIANRCGYENPNYLKNLFKRRFAMTMREFRNRANKI